MNSEKGNGAPLSSPPPIESVQDVFRRTNAESEAKIKQLFPTLEFDHEDNANNVPKVLYSVAFLMDWMTGCIDHPLDEWASHVFASILRQCADHDALATARAVAFAGLATKLEDEIKGRSKAKAAAAS